MAVETTAAGIRDYVDQEIAATSIENARQEIHEAVNMGHAEWPEGVEEMELASQVYEECRKLVVSIDFGLFQTDSSCDTFGAIMKASKASEALIELFRVNGDVSWFLNLDVDSAVGIDVLGLIIETAEMVAHVKDATTYEFEKSLWVTVAEQAKVYYFG